VSHKRDLTALGGKGRDARKNVRHRRVSTDVAEECAPNSHCPRGVDIRIGGAGIWQSASKAQWPTLMARPRNVTNRKFVTPHFTVVRKNPQSP